MFVEKTGESRVVESDKVDGVWVTRSSDERSDINMSTSIELMRRKVRFMVGGGVCDGT